MANADIRKGVSHMRTTSRITCIHADVPKISELDRGAAGSDTLKKVSALLEI